MRILMVNKFLHPNGGSETYIFKLGEYLTLKGHEVQYFGMEHKKRCVGNHVNAYTSNMDFHGGSKLKKLTYSIKTIYSMEARKKIRLVLNDFHPDVVHLNNFNYQLTPSIILEVKKYEKENKRKVKIVYTAHDYQLICPNHMMYNPNTNENCEKCINGKFINCTKGKCIHGSYAKSFIGTLEAFYWNIRKTYIYIDTIICCSEFMKSKMDTNPLFSSKTVTLHNFIDEVEWKDIPKKDYVLYFGRFSKEKGIKTLIEVCKMLPYVNFIFAGSGSLENEINKIPNIKNVGFKTGKELETLIREARFSVYPSEWYENCPFSVMESQMYGTPVLGSNIGGIPELIQVGQTGELFENGNILELKEKIEKLWLDNKLIEEYSQNCKNIKFDTIEQYYKKIMKIYEEKINSIYENIILTDFEITGNWRFKKALEDEMGEQWKIISLKSNINHGGKIQNFKRYCKYFWLPLKIFINHKKYKRVIAWQQFYGLILAFYFKLFHVKNIPEIIVMTFIYKPKNGFIGKLYDKFIRYIVCSGYIYKYIVFSSNEPDYYAKYFNISKEYFVSLNLGIDDENYRFDTSIEKPQYFIAAGRSNRDYDFLVDTLKDTSFQIKIICDEFKGPKYSNIEYFTNCHGDDYLKMLAHSFCVLIPLKDENISSGQLVILQAMMFKKPIIITHSNGISDYIQHGKNGLISIKDKNEFIKTIDLLNDINFYKKISENAYQTYKMKFSLYNLGKNIGQLLKGEL